MTYISRQCQILLLGATTLLALNSRADYPLVSHKFAADPAALEFNGRLYLYCSNDTDNDTNGYSMRSISCYSSDDLKNWTDHGEVLQAPRDVSWASFAWAPSALSNNNLIYLYFANGAGSIGVTTSSVPTGPFKDARGSALINSSTPGAATATQWYFDPCIFLDGAQPYLYFGGSEPTNARVIALSSTLTSVSGSAMSVSSSNFFEASYLHKRSNIYYFSYSSKPAAGMKIQYATNSNPTTGFQFVGDVLANPPANDFNNNHHSFFSYQGNWYVAYHNRIVAQQRGLPTTYKRSLCLDAVTYGANGTLQAVVFTTNGLSQLKNLNPYGRVEAETIAQQAGIATEPSVAGGMNVTGLTNGAWTMVRGVDFGSGGATNFIARVASAGAGGAIELRLDSLAGTMIGTCVVPVTGGAQTWAAVSCSVSNASAKNVHDLHLKFTGPAGTNLFNFDWWKFQNASSNASTRFVLKASDNLDTTSFNTTNNWVTNGTVNPVTSPPGPGGLYDTATFTLRTPTNVTAVTFGGDSLTLLAGAPAASGSLILKGANGCVVTIGELIFSGGVLSHGQGVGPAGIQSVAGYGSVVSNSLVSGLGQSSRYIGLAANLSGVGSLSNDCNVIYSGDNIGFIGAMSVGGGGAIQISEARNLGGNPPVFNAAQLLLNNGTLQANASVTLANPNSGITLGSDGGGFTNQLGTILTIANPITGTGALYFRGAGDLVLSGSNTFTGETVIGKGRLCFDGLKTGNGNITLSNAAALKLTAAGPAIAPSILTLGSGSGVTLEYDDVTNTVAAPLVAGNLIAGGTVSFKINRGPFVVGQSYPLLAWSSGAPPPVALALLVGATGTLTTNGNSIRLNITSTNATLVKVEAESGVLGADWLVSNTVSPAFITISTDGAGSFPSTAARIATYSVLFPTSGSYDLYAHVRVGPGTFNDDSLFYGNGFGVKDPVLASDWILVNGLGSGGFFTGTDVVTGGGTAGAGVWKWINLSELAGGISFNVTNGVMSRTFQIGARENGLELDTFAFGLNGVVYTVNDLESGVDGVLPPGVAVINWNDLRQQMDGFGAGVVFLDAGVSFTDASADTLFKSDITNQLALTLLRVRIEPNSSWTNNLSAWSGSVADAKRAALRGAGVLATPWTPPAAMKDNGALTNGSLLPAQFANYASYLEKYASNMLANGVSLRAVSVQNEPDWATTYESCVWSGASFLNFFRTNAATIKSAPVMMPESLGFNFSFSDPALNDAAAVTNIGLIGGHLYGMPVVQLYTNALAKGKRVWQTEYLENDQSMPSALLTARQIHDCVTTGSMSAYIWWKCLDDNNGLLNGSGVIQRRGYVMSQFSRFVRPGDRRLGETNSGSSIVSAYRNTTNNQFAIIAINPYSLPVSQTVVLTNFAPALTLAPFITSEIQSVAPLPSFAVTNGGLNYTLPPMSIITFVGQVISNMPPVMAAVGPLTVNPGVTVLVTNTAVDTDLPAQLLAFTLLAAPTNASLSVMSSNTTLFTWRSLISQAGTTNAIQVKVSDNGVPSLSATNSFVITVNPVTSPVLSSLVLGSQVSLTASGMLGPDYSLLTSTNLSNWQLLFTTNPAALPITLMDTNRGDSARFYRLQLGP